ncbi:MAG TPA: cupin domain-containing protein [Candidatus Saccharimonadales bacterium]|nr:cupin domain-containing protein [Candidatus Saccharimonadales bacterium]
MPSVYLEALSHSDAKLLLHTSGPGCLVGHVWEQESPTPAANVAYASLCRPLAPHFHDKVTEWYVVMRGTGKLLLDWEERDLRPGTLHCIPAQTDYAVIPSGDEALQLVIFCSPRFDPNGWHEVDLSVDDKLERWSNALWAAARRRGFQPGDWMPRVDELVSILALKGN